MGSVTFNALLQVAMVVVIGNLAYGADWPEDPLLLVMFTLLGVACFASLGVAFSHAIPNQDAAPAYTNAVFLPADLHLGRLLLHERPAARRSRPSPRPCRSAHLIDGLSAAIVGGTGGAAVAAAVLGAWTLAGLVLAVRFFRWE